MAVEHLRAVQPVEAGQLEVEEDQVDGGAAVLLDGLQFITEVTPGTWSIPPM